ncbi:MAG: cyclic nucleotide-binding domain-containing protein [Candidatus Hydrogenedentes bacterium]|nr:cyclic nucleotide-binding domain-containing protein [Candidatus Hydrogenedentota bacterium]
MLRWGREKETKAAAAPGVAAQEAPARVSQARAPEAPAPPPSLPELLVNEGHISEQAIQRALEVQKETGEFLGDILVREGAVDERSLTSLLAKVCKIPHLSLLDYLIEADVVKLVPEEICLRHRLIPIDRLGRNLTVAMVNPLDQEALQAVRTACPDLRVKPILCANRHFAIVANRLFKPKGGAVAELSASSLGLSPPTVAKAAPAPVKPAEPSEPELPDAIVEESGPEPALATPPPVDAPHEVLAQAVFSGDLDTEEEEAASPPAASVAETVTTAMIESMRETYALLARRMRLFHGIAPEDVAQFFSRGMTVDLRPGEVVFEAGSTGNELFLILSGELVIYNEAMELAVLEQGDMFGEMSLVSEAPRSASARALGSASVLRLSHEALWQLLPKEVSLQVMVNIAVTLSERLRKANDSVAQLPEHKAAIAEQLVQLAGLQEQNRKRADEAHRLEQALIEMQDAVFAQEQEQVLLEQRIESLQTTREEARRLAKEFLKKLEE